MKKQSQGDLERIELRRICREGRMQELLRWIGAGRYYLNYAKLSGRYHRLSGITSGSYQRQNTWETWRDVLNQDLI